MRAAMNCVVIEAEKGVREVTAASVGVFVSNELPATLGDRIYCSI